MNATLKHRVRRALRRGVGPVLRWRGLVPMQRAPVWTIFAGHEVGEQNSHLPADMRLTAETLKERLRWASEIGDVVSVRQGLSLMARQESRKPLISFSFDDGYRGVAEHAAPVLRELGLRATLFVHTGTWDEEWLPWTDLLFLLVREEGALPLAAALDEALACGPRLREAAERSLYELKGLLHREIDAEQRDEALKARFVEKLGPIEPWRRRIYLAPEELSALEDVFEIGAHGVRHRRHAKLDAGARRGEIHSAIERIEKALGHPPEGFAYPFGREDDVPERDGAALLHAGHAYACTMREGVNSVDLDPYALERWPLEEGAPVWELESLVRGGLQARWLRR